MCFVATRNFSLVTPDEVYERKLVYDKKVTTLRKQWAAEYKLAQEQALEKKRLETKRVVLQKAIRLRGKREDAAARKALKDRNNERVKFFYKEHLAKLKIIREKKAEVQKKRFETLVKSLDAESKYWVTPENMHEKITEELFNKPCTTGVVTKVSEYWGTCALLTNPNRILFGERLEMKGEERVKAIQLRRQLGSRVSKENVKAVLNTMIGTGEDREKFEELVDDFSAFTSTGNRLNRKPVNYSATPDPDNMTREDYFNMFEGENDYEEKFVKDTVDQLLEGNEEVVKKKKFSRMSNFEDDQNDDLGISENEFQLDNGTSSSSNVNLIGKDAPPLKVEKEVKYVKAEEEDNEPYASADPTPLEDLIQELDFVTEDDEEALLNIFDKIKRKVVNKNRI